MTITFDELRKIKDSLPDGSMHQIAGNLGIPVETVRNYFGGRNFRNGEAVDIHFEPGPNGGIVRLEDTAILNMAKSILGETKQEGQVAAE
ncbi:MAG: DNA-binding protein [Bacteroidota bacterium]